MELIQKSVKICYLAVRASLEASKEVHIEAKFLLGEQIVCHKTHEDMHDLNGYGSLSGCII